MKENNKLRQRIYLNDHWKFSHTWEEGMENVSYEEQGMEEVRLPHSNAEIPFNYGNEEAYQELMGYRLHFTAEESWQGKAATVTFEGAAHEAVLYINGNELLIHRCGYTAFSADLSPYLNYGGDNVLSVRLDSRETLNIPPFGKVIDYMTYGGIYREAYLEIHEKSSIKDVYAATGKVTEENPLLYLTMELDGWEEIQNKRLALELSLTPADTPYMKEHTPANLPTLMKNRIAIKKQLTKVKLPVQDVTLWDVDHPALFDLEMVLLADGEPLDERTVRMGFREIRFEADGFYLNGEKLRLRGLDRHQSYPYVGYAMPASMQEMDADVLKKELGLNAVRTSHYPQSHHFFNRCDEIGLLVFTEIPGWQHIGDEEWKKQAIVNTEEMVLQY
ncbi:MAG: glycoside hydrolase family 2 TIM barrel-domain containing protein, partial [Eubacteriales bacterium]|nr:glycoside hydrolase family 2 TIM barrel-domain containing protein [Eubacteriales bacterium]